MLTDQDSIDDIRQQWHTVRHTEALLEARLLSGIAFAPWLNNLKQPLFAMLLLFAFTSLESFLKQARREGLFKAKSAKLGDLMAGSRDTLTWQDYDAVDVGRNVRNSYAHDQVEPSLTDTIASIDAIERELVGWAILPGPVKYVGTFSLK